MKKSIVPVISALIMILCVGCGKGTITEADVIGKWRCELYGSELVIEFTPDSRFISHTDGTENRFTVEKGCIVTYVEGDINSEIALEASVDGDKLIYGGVEYEKVAD